MTSTMIRRPGLAVLLPVLLLLSFPALCPKACSGLPSDRMPTQFCLDSWSSADGLPSSAVVSILQTRDGYIWLATFDGLARFDGMSFTVFNRATTQALTTNSFWCLAEDPSANLWIGSNGGGLYLRKDGNFVSFGLKEGLSSEIIRCLLAEPDGTVWAGTQKGLDRLRLIDGKWVIDHPADNFGIKGDDLYVTSLLRGEDGNLWVGTRSRGLFSIGPSGVVSSHSVATGLPANQVFSLARAEGNGVWASIYGGGLCLVNGVTINRISADEKGLGPLVTCLLPDGSTLWVGTEKGLFRMYPQSSNGDSAVEIHGLDGSDGLTDNTIQALYQDHEGSLWIGTWRGGLCRLRNGKFLNFGTREGLAHEIVHSIFQDTDESMWFGTQGGLTRLDGASSETFTMASGHLPDNMVRNILRDRSGTLWVATYGGLARFEGKAMTPKFYTTAEGLSNNLARVLFQDSRGRLWIGTRDGLNEYLPETDGFKSFSAADGLGNGFILSITEDKSGNLLIGTDGGGLLIMKDAKFSSIGPAEGLASGVVFRVYPDSEGLIWATGNNGLSILRPSGISVVDSRDGLPGDVIFQCLPDSMGNLWFSCSKGVFKASKRDLLNHSPSRDLKIRNSFYDSSDGMKMSECTGVAQGIVDRAGKIWFPTLKGASAIDPVSIPINGVIPRLKLEGLVIDGQPGLEGQEWLETGSVRIAAGARKLEISYTALSFICPPKVMFRYRLVGLDDEWSEPVSRRTAYYTNLNPGDYRFEFMACNNDGIWNDVPGKLKFRIEPFFWQTPAFSMSLVLFAFFMAAWGYRLRVRVLKNRNLELERIVSVRTEEVRSQAKEISRKNSENERLLLNILPKPVADRLKAGETLISDSIPMATILFSDLVGFTTLCSSLQAKEVVGLLNDLFSTFDEISCSRGIEKIKTMGDGYMAAGGLPGPDGEQADPATSAVAVMKAAQDMLDAVEKFNAFGEAKLVLRVGLHSGPIIAGVIGSRKFAYDLWGDTVNTASRMESHGLPGRIHLTATTAALIGPEFSFEARGDIEIKGKGSMKTFLAQ